jgi:hypothetical protein
MSSIEAIKQELNRTMATAAKATASRQNKRGLVAQRGRIPPMARQMIQKAARVEQDAGPSSVDVVVTNAVKPCTSAPVQYGSISLIFFFLLDRYMFEKVLERSESRSRLVIVLLISHLP